MNVRQEQFITANNSLQNLGEEPLVRTSALGNLSIECPTVEEMNAGMRGGHVKRQEDNVRVEPHPSNP